jgi:hypothetical protein
MADDERPIACIADTRRFASAGAALEALRAEHVPGKYVYRGQTRRPEPVSIGGVPVEPLFPSDFRFAAERKPLSAERLEALTRKGTDPAAALADFLKARSEAGAPGFDWLRELSAEEEKLDRVVHQIFEIAEVLPVPPAEAPPERHDERLAMSWLSERLGVGASSATLMRFGALAQHYLIPAGLVDVTLDPNVALWFAINEWNEAAPQPDSGHSVVYRFDCAAMLRNLTFWHTVASYHALKHRTLPPPRFALQSIADLPQLFACRPARQQGASISGFSPFAMYAMAHYVKFIDVFEVARGGPPPELYPVYRGYLMPDEDPFLALLGAFAERLEA